MEIVVIEDNKELEEDTLMWALQDKFGKEHAKFFMRPQEALDYLSANLDKNIIVLLDIDFPKNEKNGHQVLSEIKEMSKLIPVILWSGIDENKEKFSDFINNHAFAFISKTATLEEALKAVDAAVMYLETSLDNAIEEWIVRNEQDKNKPIYLTSEGRSYTLNDILKEIRTQTPVGKEFSQKFNLLTIDLLLRNKENLK